MFRDEPYCLGLQVIFITAFSITAENGLLSPLA